MVIVAKQLARHLAHAVNGRRPHDGILRCLHFRGVGAESADGTRREEGAVVFTRYLQRIHQGTHIYLPCLLRVRFAYGRQQRHQVVDGVYLVFFDHLGIGFAIERIKLHERPVRRQHGAVAHIRSHDILVPVDAPQPHCEFGTDLAAGPDDKNLFHVLFII